MARDPRYDVLFEPVKIGPVTAKNRFYQVPHCNGMGYRDATALAAMRAVKAEGGWAVVCSEQAEIHPSSEICPFIELRIWDDQDIPMLARIADAIHTFDALAGMELCHNGMNSPNFYSREVPLGPANLPIATFTNDPVQAKAMDKTDIANLRRWHRNAALRAKKADYDIVYVYAAKLLGGPMFFLSRRYNDRTDEYGGSLENRARLLRELIEDTKEAVGDRCGVACRISTDELIGEEGWTKAEAEDLMGLIGELPDLWDLTISGWDNDSSTSRFEAEAYEEPYVRGIKQLTTKPVVGVGRFTSPDTMVRMVREGVLDLIGAARPSIADPFLPKKIEEGRAGEIRECIGCNICVSGDFTMSPIRCTQNPSMGEEWRRGWHPERISPAVSRSKVLVVGAGPAGLEAAMMLGRRGYEVTLAEATRTLGGRVVREAKLPGLAAWKRVADYRTYQLEQMSNVEIFRDSRMTAEDIFGYGAEHLILATGSHWRRDGVGRRILKPLPIAADAKVFTPDDIMAGKHAGIQSALIFDDDHYYMGGVLAELLAREGVEVALATPAADASNWMHMTMEQFRVQQRLTELGVRILSHKLLDSVSAGSATLKCVFTGRTESHVAEAAVLVTARLPDNALALSLQTARIGGEGGEIASITTVGDALAPGTIAAAVFSGRRCAEEMDAVPIGDGLPFRREVTALVEGWRA
jgi:dimethylamine/trimethylamine dehydrogenase